MNEYYNLTALVNSTDFAAQIIVANGLVNYMLGVVILLTVFIVLFSVLKIKGFSLRSCLGASGFISFILALLMNLMGLITGDIMVIVIILLCLILVALVLPWNSSVDDI